MEIIIPRSKEHWLELRSRDITSTEIAALFGISPYISKFELWHNKKNQVITRLEENERMTWGKRLEATIAQGIAEDNGWKIRKMEEYIRNPELRLGASFDFAIQEPINPSTEAQPSLSTGAICYITKFFKDTGLLEIKNVDYFVSKDSWIQTDTGIEAAPHIELQCQHQLLVSGLPYLKIGALVGGNSVILIHREPDHEIFNAIIEESKKFWESIESNTPPPIDFKSDAEFITKLYSRVQPGLSMESTMDIRQLAFNYRDAHKAESEAKKTKEATKAEIITLVGEAEKVLDDEFTISAPVKNGKRNFRIHWKGEVEA